MICSPQSPSISIWCAIIAINLIGPTWHRASGKLGPAPAVAATEAFDNIEQNPAPAATTKYELKFQTELDNSTVVKQAGQQQVFKCQVRLAPLGAVSSPANLQQPSTGRPRFKSVSRAIEGKKAAQFEDGKSPNLEQIVSTGGGGGDGGNSSLQNKSPATVAPLAAHMNMTHISIEWFRNEQHIGDKWHVGGGEQGAGLDEPITVINVTLKSRASKAKTKSRVEIKNTLNSSQLKLTSRLRVGHLRFTDSGQYKCVARSSFIINQQQINNKPILVEQSLESNATTLVIVSNASSSNVVGGGNLAQEKAANDEAQGGGSAVRTFGRKKWIATSDLAKARASQHQLLHQGLASTKNIHYSPTDDAGQNTSTISSGTAQFDGDQNSGDVASSKRDYNQGIGLFEDDEDLFRMDSGDLSELVNGQAPGTNDDNTDSSSSTDNDAQDHSTESIDDNNNNNNSNNDSGNDNVGNLLAQHIQRKSTLREQQQQQQPDAYFDWVLGESGPPNTAATSAQSDSPSSAKFRLAKFVQNIAPELSCYTGLGEEYQGHIATSVENRVCLNWYRVRHALAAYKNKNRTLQDGTSNETKDRSMGPAVGRNDNHNYCRNPNLDQGGPWCFVYYSELHDGQLLELSAQNVLQRQQQQSGMTSMITKLTTQKQRIARIGANRQLFVIRPCNISSCSEYLWLYIVAPSLGLLVLLTCLIGVLIRAIRKSHYNAIFSAAYQRHSNSSSAGPTPSSSSNIIANRLSSVFRPRNRLAHKSKGNYLGDDIFEIVDDIDWSDSNTHSQSMSPKSCESFKLNTASFSPSTASPNDATHRDCGTTIKHQKQINSNKSTLTHSKSINPILTGRLLDEPPIPPPQRTASNMSKSKSQAGPMFATLRCSPRSTSTSAAKTGHLISCSSSSSSTNTSATTTINDSNMIDCSNNNKCIVASDLPRLDASSVTVTRDTQPIYEGKFSQVQMAYLKQQEGDLTQATGRIGAQVAVCALKQQAAIDQDVFVASNLRLRNLNHLNILKLIGVIQDPEARNTDCDSSVSVKTCALVYDTAHLIDLSDWLKEQCKDAVIAHNDDISGDLSIKQNLSCLAKQIALAVDYLHDKNIIYKDLACRNCFLDVTRMLVKLASFNVELEIDNNNNGCSDLKSMVRPKYLLDYYVIDSRPSECQLLPLSWIPLESILFNKFNEQTDIWSFGCLLYELFSLGEVAYFGYSSKQIIDSVRSNLMPPQPLLCPNGIYKLMCTCLSDIPTLRPNIKHIYEQLNLYSGQCSSFLNHHLCTI